MILYFGGQVPAGYGLFMARLMFTWVVADEVQDVLVSLRDDVLPVFAAAFADWEQTQAPTLDSEDLNVQLLARLDALAAFSDICESTEAPAAVVASVCSWCERWHLTADWNTADAIGQLTTWSKHPELAIGGRGSLNGFLPWWTNSEMPDCYVEYFSEPTSWERFTFEHAGWDPLARGRKRIEYEIRAAFEHTLGEYLDGVERRITADATLEPLSGRTKLRKHLEWLVRYQVLRQPWPEIAATADRELANGRRVPVSADFVARRVKALAAFIELPLDPVRRAGRPAGKTTENTTQNRVAREWRRR